MQYLLLGLFLFGLFGGVKSAFGILLLLGVLASLLSREKPRSRYEQTHYYYHGFTEEVFQDKQIQYLTVLGLPPSATESDIKKAYKAACKKYHPDKVHHLGGVQQKVAEAKIKQINEAYDYLSKGGRP